MMANYQNNVQYIDFEDLEEYLELIVEIVLKPSRFLLKKLNSLSNRKIKKVNKEKYQANQDILINKYNELEVEFNNDKINLYQEMDSLASSLKNSDFFYDEYFDFCEIKDIIKYTFDRDFSLIKDEDLEFILELVISFSKIISYKLDLIENDSFNEKKFESEYNDYLTNFNKSITYYY